MYTLKGLKDNTTRFRNYEDAECFNYQHFEGEYTICEVVDTHDQRYGLYHADDLDERFSSLIYSQIWGGTGENIYAVFRTLEN